MRRGKLLIPWLLVLLKMNFIWVMVSRLATMPTALIHKQSSHQYLGLRGLIRFAYIVLTVTLALLLPQLSTSHLTSYLLRALQRS